MIPRQWGDEAKDLHDREASEDEWNQLFEEAKAEHDGGLAFFIVLAWHGDYGPVAA